MLMLLVVLSSGCASIICKGEKMVKISSEPTGANFIIKNRKGKVVENGITPTSVYLKKGSGWFRAGDYTISMSQVGFVPTTQKIKQDLEWFWYLGGNAVIGGAIGWVIIDPLTGAMWTIDDVNISLESATNTLDADIEALILKLNKSIKEVNY
ncbi:hypothetical protein LCGC14_2747550, partial [marine sediment metagenome]